MISLEEAVALIEHEASYLGAISLPVAKAVGYALAAPIVARVDSPAFDNSSVDGYGIQMKDLPRAMSAGLKLRGTIHAGEVTRKKLRSQETFKIMTGAFVPRSVEAIVMREQTEDEAGLVQILRSVVLGQNIRKRGSEFTKGETLLQRGTRVSPAVLGLLAGQGIQTIRVARKPTIGILITGDELKPIGADPRKAQINDSNSPMLRAMCNSLGIQDVKIIVVGDHPAKIQSAIRKLLEREIVIAVGGVSVGDRDLVKDQLELAGVRRIFWGIDMKPGKPNYFGVVGKSLGKRKSGKHLVFGLPGNPVSAVISFKKLVEPAIKKMQRIEVKQMKLSATLQGSIKRDRSRVEYVRGVVSAEDGLLIARPRANQGSGMLGGLAAANALIRIEPGDHAAQSGTMVEVEFLRLP